MNRALVFSCLSLVLGVGCGSGTTPNPPGVGGGSAQTPPQGGAALETWLTGGAYKSWHCEGAAHAPRGPSPHFTAMGGGNRICENDSLFNFSGAGEFPTGIAAVKELFDAVPPGDASKPMGYAVYLKTGSGDCTNYYYYERAGTTVVSDGAGTGGTPNSICVGCHAGAGMDQKHLAAPAGNAHDCVYTQVK